MNIDRFIQANRARWERLDQLTRTASRNPARLSTDELEELVTLYERVNTHLSLARTQLRDPGLVAHLSRLTAAAGAVVYGGRARTWRAFSRFVADTFPAAMWHTRHFIVIAAALFCVPAAAVALWFGNSPRAMELAFPDVVREAYVEDDFEAYYSSAPAAQFASAVTTNNIRVAVFAFTGGVLLCVPTVLVLIQNGLNLGVPIAAFAAVSQLPRFWGLILPHGLLELTAVFVAGAAGLRLGWTLIDPGDRRRGEALTEEGQRAMAILIGLVAAFVVAGLIEGFVTGSGLPTFVRVGIGALVEVVFVLYVVVRGRSAAARGLTGALGEDRGAGWARDVPAG
ncbi:MAG: stage II sporulation protein M [Nitriliruptorales bacterium]|nr:stage II sporulation protein M [Nitriliruptorales bacterium]